MLLLWRWSQRSDTRTCALHPPALAGRLEVLEMRRSQLGPLWTCRGQTGLLFLHWRWCTGALRATPACSQSCAGTPPSCLDHSDADYVRADHAQANHKCSDSFAGADDHGITLPNAKHPHLQRLQRQVHGSMCWNLG